MKCLLTLGFNKKAYGIWAVCLIVFILFLTAPSEASESRNFSWYWMFYENDISNSSSSFVIRPFFLRHKTDEGFFEASLIPAVYWRYKTKKKDSIYGLFGLVQSTDYFHNDGTRDYDIAVFPFLFYGKSEKKSDRYLLLWPFGGSLKGKFGYDKISAYVFPGLLLFVFFPQSTIFYSTTWLAGFYTTLFLISSYLPVYTQFEKGDYRAHAIFWPVIMWGRGPGRKEFRFFPFYTHKSKKDFYDRYNVLFIINYQKNYFRNDTHYALFILPIFGRKWSDSGDLSSYAILWPFFSWGYNKRKGEVEYNLPWPLVQIRDCKKPYIKKRIFFPFYGDYYFEKDRTFFVTPLYFYMSKKSVRFDSEYYFISIISWYFERKYHGEPHPYYGNEWKYYKLWPLIQWEKNDKGNLHVNLFSLLPFRDDEGYEKLYQTLWTLFEYQVIENYERRIGFLLRFYFHRFSKDFDQVQIPMVISYDKRKDTMVHCSVLLNMFGYDHKKRGKYLRLFWIPIRIGDSDADALEGTEKYAFNENAPGKTGHISDLSWPMSQALERNYILIDAHTFERYFNY